MSMEMDGERAGEKKKLGFNKKSFWGRFEAKSHRKPIGADPTSLNPRREIFSPFSSSITAIEET